MGEWATGRCGDLRPEGLKDFSPAVAGLSLRGLVSCPISNMAFVAIKMGRRQGARRAHICIDT